MWSNRRIVELFEIEHPIVLAPMAGLGTVDLAAAVSNAGGLGSIGCAIMAPELIANSVAELRRSTPKPINLLLLPRSGKGGRRSRACLA